MEITGRVYRVFDTETLANNFQKREFVIDYAENPSYPQKIKFELIKDKVDVINGFSEGDAVVVHFNLRGREWSGPAGETKFFNTLQAWKLERMEATQPQPQTTEQQAPPEQAAPFIGDEGEDDLPF